MPHRAPHDPAQHIAAPFIARQHTIGDQKTRAAQMIRHHAVAHPVRPVGGHAGRLGARRNQRAERIGIVVVVHALQNRRNALQPHARVDRGMRQRNPRAGRPLLVLHEHQVPDFDEPVAILLRAAGRPAGDMLAMIVENLAARTARPGVAHTPEIVGRRNADNPVIRQPRDARPQPSRVLVLGKHRHQQPVLRQAELTRDQVPGELDRQRLEVIAKTEIAEHFEKRVVPRGVAHVIEIVVLAAGAHAFLRRRGAGIRPPLLASEHVLELHHAGIGKQQRRVVARHQWRTGHHRVPIAGKAVEEGGADVIATGHGTQLAHD